MSDKKQPSRNTIIGKKALLISARGEVELAAQLFYYEQVREVRLDTKNNEIKLLMNYDESYFRVFQTFPENDTEEAKKESTNKLLKFYNDLLYAAMSFTKEEVESLNSQIEKQRQEQLEKNSEATSSNESDDSSTKH